MGRLTTTATTTTVQEIQLKPKLEKQLRAALEVYAEVDAAYKAAKEARDVATGEIEELREVIGETSFKFAGNTITRVGGTTKSLDKKKLVELGCAMAWIEEATTEKPKKQYTKVTLAGQKEEE